jgi:DNA mismatch repair ATPase MutS
MSHIPISKDKPAIFPYKAREHGIYVDQPWVRGKKLERFSPHLGIDDLIYEIEGYVSTSDRNIGRQIYHLEPDPAKIQFRQDLVAYVTKQPQLLEKLADVHYVPIKDMNCDDKQRKPQKIVADYMKNMNALIAGITSTSKEHPFFQEVLKLCSTEHALVTAANKDLERQYELRAAYDITVQVKKETLGLEKDKKIEYRGENVRNLEIQVMEPEQGISETIRRTRKSSGSGIHIGPAVISEFELKKVTGHIVEDICKRHRIKPTDGDTLTAKLSAHAQQTGRGRFNSIITYQIHHGDVVIEGSYKKQGGAGLPFVAALNAVENANVDAVFEPMVENVIQYNKLFSDLNTLGGLAEASILLLKKGAKWATIGSPETYIKASRLQNPLTKLQGKRTTPNAATGTQDRPFTTATGANFNGKTFHGVSEVQNLVLAQAALPTFGIEAFYPRSQVLAHFPDYDGDLEGKSFFSGSCRRIRSLLEHIEPHAYLLIDEPGTGTGFGDAINIFGDVFSEIAQLKTVRTYFSSHFLPLVEKLSESFSTVDPIKFELGKNGRKTFKHAPGIAKTSEGMRIANQEGLGKKGLKQLRSTWENKGLR